MADRSLVEHFAKNRGNVGRGPDDGFAYRGILHGLEESVGFIAGLHAAAQGFGLLLPRLDRSGRGSAREDQDDRLHLVFKGLGLLLLVAADLDGGGYVLLADLQALLVASADQ